MGPLIVAAVIALAALLAGGWYSSQWDRVDPGNAGIKKNYCTGAEEVITTSSYIWVDWRCERLIEYPTAEYTTEMINRGQGNNDAVPCVMKDQQTILMDTASAWSVDPARVADLYRMRPGVSLAGLGSTIEQLLVRSEVRAGLRDACTLFNWEEAYGARRQEYEATAEKMVQSRLDPVGIKVRTVSIRAMDPSDQLDALIVARLEGQKLVEATAFAAKQAENRGAQQLAEQKAASALQLQQGEDAYKLQQAQARADAELKRINAEAAMAQAESQARTAKIQADSSAEVENTKTAVEAQRVREMGLAEGEANKARAASITPAMVDYERARKWNGAMPANGNVVTSTGPVVVPPGAPTEAR